jgi:hypothetical protein
MQIMKFNLTQRLLFILTLATATVGSGSAFAEISYKNIPPYNGQPPSVTSQFQIMISGEDAQNLYAELKGPELIEDDDCELIVKFGESITCYYYPNLTAAGRYSCVTLGELPSGKMVGPIQKRKARMKPATQVCGSLAP